MLESAFAREASTARDRGSCGLSTGESLGTRWTIDAVLSSSSTEGTTVYAATDARARRAAIKLLSDEASEQRFVREIVHTDAASIIGGPRLLGYGTARDGARYLALDLLSGRTLQQHWVARGGRFDLATALLLTERLLGVVNELHGLGIVHRDIHPTNVFVTSFGDVRVLDFSSATRRGEALALEEHTHSAPGFAPPEQLNAGGGELPGDPRVDVFAVGAVLFWMLTGSSRPIAHMSAGASREFPIDEIAHLPCEVLEFLELALAFEPQRRLASAALMHDVLAGMRHALSGLDRSADEA